MTDSPEALLARFGRMICDAPFRYERCMFSFDGDGGRRLGGFSVGFSPDHGSRDADATGGVRMGDWPLESGIESAWKNLSC